MPRRLEDASVRRRPRRGRRSRHGSRGTYAGFNLNADGVASAPIEFFAEPGVLVNSGSLPARNTASISKTPRTSSSTASRSPAWRGPACGRSASTASRSPRTSRFAMSSRYNNGDWGILTGFVNDLLIENNIDVRLGRRARHLRLQQRRPAGDSQQRRRSTTAATAST